MNSTPQIFKERLIKNRLEHFTRDNVPDFDARFKEVGLWCNATAEKHLDRTKETNVQGAFMTRLFNQVFGYAEIIDNAECYNQEREFKTVLDTTESDGALGFFNKTAGTRDVRVVIELKDARTSLDKKQNRSSHLTPVEQAFSYANKNGSKCGWVIVSNFVEIRLYKSNSSLEYETFDMRKMKDEKEFLRLYYFLCKDHLIAESGKSVIDELYQENEAEGVEITNQFYSTYKTIRNNLFTSLKENNPGVDEILLFTKSQKLMDRFIFICFCEDCNLLPQNIYRRLIETAKQSFSFTPNKLWEQLRGLFAAIDQGNPPMKINRYNGGLFKTDPELDSLAIPDDILETFVELSDYDFNSDLNVNILGQIFEQSISDVEQIKAEISGAQVGNGKQKDDGIFYTPYYVTRYIVEQTVGTYLAAKKEELKRSIFANGTITVTVKRPSTKMDNHKKFTHWVDIPPETKDMPEDNYMDIRFAEQLHLIYWTAYEEVLKNIKICDPACGSGAFLNQCFDYLHEEMDFVLDMKRQLDKEFDSLFDIDKEILQNNLYGVDINPESVEITKLSLWLKTAKNNQTLATLDGNIKCGNSIVADTEVASNAFEWQKEFPGIFANGGFDIVIGNPPYGAKLDQATKKYITKEFKTSEGRFDTYHTFIELGMRILKKKGYLGYITPNTYLILENSTVKLRQYLFDNFTVLNFVELYNVFPNAVVEPIISIFYKGISNTDFTVISIPRKTALTSTFINEGLTTVFRQADLKEKEGYIFNYRENDTDKIIKSKIRNNAFEVQDKFKVVQGAIPYGKGEGTPPQTQETVDTKPFTKYEKVDETWYPYYKGKNINRYVDAWAGEWIKYGEWLCRPRTIDIWKSPKLFVRQTGDYPVATYIDGFKVAKDSIHTITPLPENEEIELKYLLALLNSKMMKWIFRSDNFHIVGKPLAQTKAIYIKRLPLKVKNQAEVIQIVNELLLLNEKKIAKANKFLKYLSSMYLLKDLSDNLREFYLYDFKMLVDELKKKKIKLSAKEKIDLMEVFDDYQKIISEDNATIQADEAKIDAFVYDAFELNDAEITYIEQNL